MNIRQTRSLKCMVLAESIIDTNQPLDRETTLAVM